MRGHHTSAEIGIVSKEWVSYSGAVTAVQKKAARTILAAS
jgi:hypothetical protein